MSVPSHFQAIEQELTLRATREDTIRWLTELRNFLQKLAEENRPLKPEERENYFQLVSRALMGIDSTFPSPLPPLELKQIFGEERASKIKTCDTFLRYLALTNHPDMKSLWEKAYEAVIQMEGTVMFQATRMSAERLKYKKAEAHEI